MLRPPVLSHRPYADLPVFDDEGLRRDRWATGHSHLIDGRKSARISDGLIVVRT
jgi:hypothetical protein